MPLLSLPGELLQSIAENLVSERDINAFARTNRRLYDLLNSYLYRYHIHQQQHGGNGCCPALLWAAEYGQESTTRILLSEGAHVQAAISDSGHQTTPLLLAAQNGHERVVRLLLATKQVDPDFKDQIYQMTPLSWAAAKGYTAVVRLLLATEGVDPDSKNRVGRTPLSHAAENGHVEVVKLLLARDGVDPNSKDTVLGWTPLFWAGGPRSAEDYLDFNDSACRRSPPPSWAAGDGVVGCRCHGLPRAGTKRWSTCCWRRVLAWSPIICISGLHCHGQPKMGTRRS